MICDLIYFELSENISIIRTKTKYIKKQHEKYLKKQISLSQGVFLPYFYTH